MKAVTTFKVHKVNRATNEAKVLLHQLDPHEEGANELAADGKPHSGDAKLTIRVTDPGKLDFFQVGALVKVTFET